VFRHHARRVGEAVFGLRCFCEESSGLLTDVALGDDPGAAAGPAVHAVEATVPKLPRSSELAVELSHLSRAWHFVNPDSGPRGVGFDQCRRAVLESQWPEEDSWLRPFVDGFDPWTKVVLRVE